MGKTAWIVFFGLLLVAAAPKAFAQQNELPQSIFVEGLGSGIFYSFNYDTRFRPKSNGWGVRVGMGYTSVEGDRIYTVPLVINYLLGRKKNFLEVGAGVTFNGLNDRTNTNISSGLVNVENGAIGTLAIGYRRVSSSGFTFRAGLTPLIGGLVEEYFWPQLSFGYSF
ncbi:hypothetical protein [Lunatibacter salilacus]|uniref:hypothetical protein n=1 Tax=Lunatibacter salilacus TaxID=2483804 RepID=UPI00131D6C69|nr:hypothetical protein [Lunatibacter salilacus]